MQRIANQLTSSLVFTGRFSFSRMMTDRESNPIKDRVMSTPTWPVPYYQRLAKAYPIRCNNLAEFRAEDCRFGTHGLRLR